MNGDVSRHNLLFAALMKAPLHISYLEYQRLATETKDKSSAVYCQAFWRP